MIKEALRHYLQRLSALGVELRLQARAELVAYPRAKLGALRVAAVHLVKTMAVAAKIVPLPPYLPACRTKIIWQCFW